MKYIISLVFILSLSQVANASELAKPTHISMGDNEYATFTVETINGIKVFSGILAFSKDMKYTGTWTDNGYVEGVLSYDDGITFEGEYDGWDPKYGTIKDLSGSIYTGGLKKGLRHGSGTYCKPDGECISGTYNLGERMGDIK